MPKRYKEPEALRHLRETLSEPQARANFVALKGRQPNSETELEIFIEYFTLEAYNGGRTEWPKKHISEILSQHKNPPTA
jgi:hypothetical protein